MQKLFLFVSLFLTTTTFAQITKTLSKTNYTIKYPDTWTLEEGSTTTSFSIIAGSDGADDKFVENINLVANNISSYTPKSYADYSKTFLPSKIKGFKVLEEKEVKQGGKTGYYMIFKGKQGNDQLKWKQYYFIEKGKVWILTFTGEEKRFADYIKKINSALSSFTIK
jgi:eukaryotic-like serine/threonine-protein kinase